MTETKTLNYVSREPDELLRDAAASLSNGIRTEVNRMLTNMDLEKDTHPGSYAFQDAYEDYEDDDFDEESEDDFDEFEDDEEFEEEDDEGDEDFDDFDDEGGFAEEDDDFDYEDDDLEYDDFDE